MFMMIRIINIIVFTTIITTTIIIVIIMSNLILTHTNIIVHHLNNTAALLKRNKTKIEAMKMIPFVAACSRSFKLGIERKRNECHQHQRNEEKIKIKKSRQTNQQTKSNYASDVINLIILLVCNKFARQWKLTSKIRGRTLTLVYVLK